MVSLKRFFSLRKYESFTILLISALIVVLCSMYHPTWGARWLWDALGWWAFPAYLIALWATDNPHVGNPAMFTIGVVLETYITWIVLRAGFTMMKRFSQTSQTHR